MTRRDLSNINYHYYNKFDHFKDNYAEFKAVHQQNQRRKRRQHKQLGGHQPRQPKPGQQQQKVLVAQDRHPTATPIAAPGRQTDSTATPTLLKSVLRVFLRSEARGIFLCKTTPTRSLEFHSRRERSSVQPSPPKPA